MQHNKYLLNGAASKGDAFLWIQQPRQEQAGKGEHAELRNAAGMTGEQLVRRARYSQEIIKNTKKGRVSPATESNIFR